MNVKKLQKPDKIFVENPNIMDAMTLDAVNAGTKRECFMVTNFETTIGWNTRNRETCLWTVAIPSKSVVRAKMANR